MQIEDPDGIRIVLVEVLLITLSGVTRDRRYHRDDEPHAAYNALHRAGRQLVQAYSQTLDNARTAVLYLVAWTLGRLSAWGGRCPTLGPPCPW